MSIDENMEQAGFAAWAATEGITNVVFSPVTAVGRTLGNVSGQRDHHLVLLDREWGIWQAARASRPREAGSGAPDEGSKWYTGDGEAFIVLPPNEVRRLRIEAAQSMRAAPVVPITHTVAPEACPECDGARDRPLKRPDAQTVRVTCADPFHTTPASAAGREGAVEVGAHAMEVAERCFYAIKGGAPYRESIRAMAAIIESERALLAAEAEGGGA